VAVLIPALWVLVTPFALAAVVAGSPWANAFAARHLVAAITIGWAGVALMVAGAFAAPHTAGWAMLVVGAPLAGLSFWMRTDGGGGDDDEPEPDPEPSLGEWDWDRFYSDLERWRLSREARRPRSPARPR
jgi:hypothetical protein